MPEKFHRVIANVLDREHSLLYLRERYGGREINIGLAYSQLTFDSATLQCHRSRFQSHFDGDRQFRRRVTLRIIVDDYLLVQMRNAHTVCAS